MKLALLLCSTALLHAANVRVQINGRVTTMTLEQYTAATLAGESSVFQSDEALKAMAIAARTYAVRFQGRHASEGFDLCDTTHCQRVDLRAVTARLEAAVRDTEGELLWFNGKPAMTYYTRNCGGRSEDGGQIWPEAAAPYLKSHADPYCVRSGNAPWRWEGSLKEISSALQQADLRTPRTLERVVISDRTPSNRARNLALIGGGESIRLSASSFRFAIGRLLGWNTLRSELFEVSPQNGRAIFYGHGAGHGAGLCQDGAEQMGREKHSYTEILSFYYPGTTVGLTAQGIRWTKLSGERLTALSTQPNIDAATLALAERQVLALAQRTKHSVPKGIELRIYPDVETFRNATGEPGWVAAHTNGTRIDLQPADVLRSRGALESTLAHELAHVLLESGARIQLPVWFREGLAAHFTTAAREGLPTHPLDSDIRQTSDPSKARAAYENARRQVAALVARYGEGTVLSWLSTGLPREVTNASAKPAPTKSK